MFIRFQNIFNSSQTNHGVVGIKCRPDLFNLDSTIILEKKTILYLLGYASNNNSKKKLFMAMK